MGRYDNGLSTLFAKMEPNQAIFVHHLRTNPHNVTQITSSLVDDDQNMCALGLGLEAFGMIKKYQEEAKRAVNNYQFNKPAFDPYAWIADKLRMPQSHVEQVYALNDDHELSFSEIADIMERYFSAGNLFDPVTKGPEELYRADKEVQKNKEKEAFVKLWDAFAAKHDALLQEAATAFGVAAYELRSNGIFETWSGEDFYDEVADPNPDW